jgi:DNA-binding MarR family transcriptional regulator
MRGTLEAEVGEQIRAFQGAVDAVDEAAAARLGVNRTDLRCLDLLLREERMTAGRLAEASGLTTGAVTALIDRLERAGYARRTPDPGDRRRVVVEPTPAARAASAELYGPVAEAGRAVLGGYGPEQLALLRDFMREARRVNEEHAARLRAAPG